MKKEKIVSLEKYLDHLKSRLKDEVPPKHKKHPNTFKQFLNNEIRIVSAALEKAKLESVK